MPDSRVVATEASRAYRRTLFGYYIFVGLLFVYGQMRPAYNFDLVGFTAAVFYEQGLRGEELHTKTYDLVRDIIPQQEYVRLTEAFHYRVVMLADPEAFTENLPLYRVRLVYVYLIRLVAASGINLVHATHLVPSVCLVIALCLVPRFFRDNPAPAQLVLLGLAAALFGALTVMQTSSADGVGYLLTIVTFLFALQGRIVTSLIFSVLMVSVRNDLMFGAGLLQIYTLVSDRNHRVHALAAGICTLAVYQAIVTYSGYFPYTTMLLFQWEGWPPYIASHEFEWTVQKQLTIWGKELLTTPIRDKSCVAYFAMCAAILFGPKTLRSNPLENLRRLVRSREAVLLVLIPFGHFWIHFFVYPLVYDRFFAAWYLLTAVYILRQLTTVEEFDPQRVTAHS